MFVPVKDIPALACAMVRVISDLAMRERMGKAGREHMDREFDERIIFAKILKRI